MTAYAVCISQVVSITSLLQIMGTYSTEQQYNS